jgi:hypothetical protein
MSNMQILRIRGGLELGFQTTFIFSQSNILLGLGCRLQHQDLLIFPIGPRFPGLIINLASFSLETPNQPTRGWR